MKAINRILSAYWIAKAKARELNLIYNKRLRKQKQAEREPDTESIAPNGWEVITKLNQTFIYPKNLKPLTHEIS